MRCSRTPPKETKVCPVCDATIDADARNCPSCLTDLSLFDLGGEPSELHVDTAKNIDDILASIMEGRSDQPEIFESLKSVGTSRSPPEAVVAEVQTIAPPPAVKAAPEEQFLCPVCDTVVQETDAVCPGCGAEFSGAEATEYECPVCKAAVPSDADRCPSCGVMFASDEGVAAEAPASPEPEIDTSRRRLPSRPAPPGKPPPPTVFVNPPPDASQSGFRSRLQVLRDSRRSAESELPQGDPKLIARELPKLVNDVKPLLLSAKRIGLEIDDGKRLINEAVQAGKRRDITQAVRFIADARRSLDVAFVEFIGELMEPFADELDSARVPPGSSVRQGLEDALAKLEIRDYDAAWDGLQAGRTAFRSQSKDHADARGPLDADAHLVAEVRGLGMDMREFDQLSKQVRETMDRRDLPEAQRIAKQAHDRLVQDVTVFMKARMHAARNTLLDLKVRGGDLSKPVGILKEASLAEKKEDWLEAIRFVKEFQKSIGKVSKG